MLNETREDILRKISLRNLDPKYYLPVDFHEDIPVFAELIFRNHTIDDEEKIKFVNYFLIKYLTDSEFRLSMQNHWVLFVKHKLYQIQSIKKAREDVPGRYNLFFEITDTPEDYYIM